MFKIKGKTEEPERRKASREQNVLRIPEAGAN
jgi:hypothetical protein